MITIKKTYALLFLTCLFSFLISIPVQAGASDAPPSRTAAPRRTFTGKIAATVNGEQITREDLAKECLRHYGEDVLESLIYTRLLEDACRKYNIKVSQKEIDQEIMKMVKQFGNTVDQWYKMLERERGISPSEYRTIIWTILAQKKLAGKELQVTEEEIRKEYESQFGPAVKVRLIAVENFNLAKEIRAKAVANPETFPDLAKKHSVDTTSASMKGWLAEPIRRHSTVKALEDAAFSLKDGQISQVISFGDTNQYIIIKREAMIPARKIPLEQVTSTLKKRLEDRKLQKAGHKIAKKLQDQAKIENYLKDPKKSKPGIAATLNGQRITIRDLAEECIKRNGKEALQGTISRRLIEQACKRSGIKITEQDLRNEIAHAASVSLPPKKDGSPNIKKWIALATKGQGISQEIYIHDAVWPSVALKKLVSSTVRVDEQDIQKGMEANYGPHAQCLAIVLDNLRRAQHVWGLAQKNPSSAHFADLAEQYSIDAATKKLRGEIPSMSRHSGLPAQLEKEAFSLKKGELSSIIEVEGKYVILLGKGLTEPINVDKEKARSLIYQDLFEKKLNIEMDKYFKTLRNTADIDNYMTGKSQSPRQKQPTTGASPLRRVKLN